MQRELVIAAALTLGLAALPQSEPQAAETTGTPDPTNSWAEGTAWYPQLDWLSAKLQDCRTSEEQSEAVCAPLVAETLERIYGVGDFHKAAAYLDHGAIGVSVAQPGSGWQALGTADDQAALDAAQDHANVGDPVLAVLAPEYGGHVAIILPGDIAPSSSWDRKVPNSASFFVAKSRRSFIGKRLSFAYDREAASAVTLYSRVDDPVIAEQAASDSALADSALPADTQAEEPGAHAVNGGLTFDLAERAAKAEQQLFESALVAARLAPAAGAPDDEGENGATQLAALQPGDFYGMWCNTRPKGDSSLVEAIRIDREQGRLSWGQADPSRGFAFEDGISRAIIEVEQEGAIVSISFSQSGNETADATAFFVMDGEDKLFESHIFDNESSEVRARDTMLQRCPNGGS